MFLVSVTIFCSSFSLRPTCLRLRPWRLGLIYNPFASRSLRITLQQRVRVCHVRGRRHSDDFCILAIILSLRGGPTTKVFSSEPGFPVAAYLPKQGFSIYSCFAKMIWETGATHIGTCLLTRLSPSKTPDLETAYTCAQV